MLWNNNNEWPIFHSQSPTLHILRLSVSQLLIVLRYSECLDENNAIYISLRDYNNSPGGMELYKREQRGLYRQ